MMLAFFHDMSAFSVCPIQDSGEKRHAGKHRRSNPSPVETFEAEGKSSQVKSGQVSMGNSTDSTQARWKLLKLKVSQVRSSQVKLVWETSQIQHKPGGNL